MSFIDGKDGENFMSVGLCPKLEFYCPVHEKTMAPHECITECSAFVNSKCLMGVNRQFHKKQ